MSEIWFTSDTHFTHDNLIKYYEDRGKFANGEEMAEYMLQAWNERIKSRDTVYHLGDFGGKDSYRDLKIFRRLNGRKHFVPGNHDRRLVTQPGFKEACTRLYPYSYAEVSINTQKIIMCHFPIWEWNGIHHGTWHLHGHVHGKPTGVPGKIFDVGADGNGLVPYHFEEIKKFMDERPTRLHHCEG